MNKGKLIPFKWEIKFAIEPVTQGANYFYPSLAAHFHQLRNTSSVTHHIQVGMAF